LTNWESARAAVEAAIAQFGGLHIPANNTGIDQRGQWEWLTRTASWRQT
jgi:NAD(P)-dependent dehydrogenase (short-subunit alcohol dehydrogenase family)